MIYKIAFASSGGERVDRHFGQADQFVIAELDSDKEDYDIKETRSVIAPCHGGEHSVLSFEEVLEELSDVSAIVAQRVGPGAAKFIAEKDIRIYTLPTGIEEALCTLLEKKAWEVDKWQYHTKS
ncbi:MAG: dinitrogenase iron-molybdenum cofactor biosynthesis protein [Ruminococcus sp.]|nr:dinitrogenase iron-molybdenum cofactor biosynthesis protein [Ruminococcus sp.]